MRLSELKKLLKKAIESENYEKASKIRDEINKRGIEKVTKEYEVIVNFIQSDLKW